MKNSIYYILVIVFFCISCNLEKIDDDTTLPTNGGKKTFVKVVDVKIPYSEQNTIYNYFVDFIDSDIRIIEPRPNPGKIEIFRFDSTGESINGYPLSSVQYGINDTFHSEGVRFEDDFFIRTKKRLSSEYIGDSCNSWGMEQNDLYSRMYKISKNDLLATQSLDNGQYNGLPCAYGFEISRPFFIKNGDFFLLDHPADFHYSNSLGRQVYGGCDLLISKYSKDLGFISRTKLDYYRDDLSWYINENNNNYFLYSMIKPVTDPCITFSGVEIKYLNKTNLSLSHIVKSDDASEFIRYLSALLDIDASTKADLQKDTYDPLLSNRLVLKLYDVNSETKINGAGFIIPPPTGYTNIDKGSILKKGDNFYVAAMIRKNPASTTNDLCLLKLNALGQIVDTDIYGITEGIATGLKIDFKLQAKSDGGFLMYAFIPETGKLTIFRVDKDGKI
jgi:hypothetical protein